LIQFSANLGFLWTEHSLPDAIRAAKAAGFHAVECHWPYATSTTDVATALNDTGLNMIGINTNRGDVSNGENGVAAIPGRESLAQQFIDESIAYATEIACDNIHVMPGFASYDDKDARDTFAINLDYACTAASKHQITILIEPLNRYDVPGYYLATLDQAMATLDRVKQPNLKIMYDCYHMQLMGGDLLSRFKAVRDQIGHIQFASVPGRTEPDSGEVNYPWLLSEFITAGYNGVFGAEYKPKTTTDDGLGWLANYFSP